MQLTKSKTEQIQAKFRALFNSENDDNFNIHNMFNPTTDSCDFNNLNIIRDNLKDGKKANGDRRISTTSKRQLFCQSQIKRLSTPGSVLDRARCFRKEYNSQE